MPLIEKFISNSLMGLSKYDYAMLTEA